MHPRPEARSERCDAAATERSDKGRWRTGNRFTDAHLEAFHATKGQPGCERHATRYWYRKMSRTRAEGEGAAANGRYLVHDMHIARKEYLEKLASSTFCLTPLVNSAPGWYVRSVVSRPEIPGDVLDMLGWKPRRR